jgi:hypothetical protein
MRKKDINQPSRENRLNLTLSNEEKEMVMVLKKKHSINMSNYIRECIRKLYEEKK